MSEAPFVIVGGGLASARAAETLREEGYNGDLIVVTTEPHHPYERPPLSKDYLRREVERSTLLPLSDDWYADHLVQVRTMATGVGLDAGAHQLTLSDGTVLDYARLLLATGSTPRPLKVPGTDLLGVLSLRTVEESDLLAAALQASARDGAGRLAIVGDGWIGMEVAASARSMGLDVTVLGLGAHPLEPVLGPEMGEVFAKLHTDHGVALRGRAEVVGITGEGGKATGVKTADGTVVDADVVLCAVGAAPNTGLASSAGIAIRAAKLGGGVAVDATLRTSEPDVFAAGDIASIPSPHYGRPIRVEHWETAFSTGPHAARAMLGSDATYDRLPYFYTDQFDLGMEYTGFIAGPGGYDEVVVSGSLEDRGFVAFWIENGRVQAGMGVNTWDRMSEVEALIRSGRKVPRNELEAFRQ